SFILEEKEAFKDEKQALKEKKEAFEIDKEVFDSDEKALELKEQALDSNEQRFTENVKRFRRHVDIFRGKRNRPTQLKTPSLIDYSVEMITERSRSFRFGPLCFGLSRRSVTYPPSVSGS
ncbi:hypothetical protein BGX26_008233, partial [Mortierella sp. AD094]